MPELLLTIDGAAHRIPFEPGHSLRDILDATDFRVRSGCRGIGACGLCRVRVIAGAAGETTQNERLHLSEAQLASGMRLACQFSPSSDMQVEILNPAPPSNWKSPPDRGAYQTHSPGGKWLPPEVRHPCGLAVDLGTTNLCLSLFDLAEGRWLADRWGRNPQQNFGADIITRLAAAQESPAAAQQISDAVVAAIGEALLDIATREGFDTRRVVNITVVGNTAMLALLSRRNFHLLLQPEYWTQHVDCRPEETSGWVVKWGANPLAEVDVVAPLAGFVGSDLLAGLVATRFVDSAAPALFIDFGTNSEIALWNGRELWVTASAGGPAFESSGISCGVPAEAGAVFRVKRDAAGKLAWGIIGDDRAHGICGSGLVDLIACLLESGQLSSTGRFAAGEMGYTFSAGGTELTLTKNDVDLMQRAKAAVGVGILALSGHAGVALKDLRRVCVGGAFGRYLDVGNAQAIGLLPPVSPETVELSGNTALAGCCDVMLSSLAAEKLNDLRSRARFVNLAQLPDFDLAFLDNLYLQPLRER
ncbi:MAG: ASKHA domain-containing protein [Sulfuricella sp.]